MRSLAPSRRRHFRPQQTTAYRPSGGCRVLIDSTKTEIGVTGWMGGEGRDPTHVALLRAERLLSMNRGILKDFGLECDLVQRGGEPRIAVVATATVGAFPLLSPLTGNPDFGLIIAPRFSWGGVGDALTYTGLKVVPQILLLPELPTSDRLVPPWVVSSVVLARIRELLNEMTRSFTLTKQYVEQPKGSIDWGEYLVHSFAAGKPNRVPCLFPDLREDADLRAALRHVLGVHKASLLSQRASTSVVARLMELCDSLLSRVSDSVARAPTLRSVTAWRRRPIKSRAFEFGLTAIEWTLTERGLAGMSDISGLSWRMDMSLFFEAWCERIAEQIATLSGMHLRVGRLAQTAVSVVWDTRDSGSQRTLIPDLVLEREDLTLIIDAKYKIHAEELSALGWSGTDEEIRARHREDLLQVLAYSTLFATQRVVACLLYPCLPSTFLSLQQRRRVVVHARLASSRSIEVLLAASPIGRDAEIVARQLANALLL
jgi:hypothetical protein